MTRAYLDHNATSPIRPAAARAVAETLGEGGNPSSVHAEGRRARARVEAAREAIAARLSAAAEDVVFTSGATEAINLAVAGAHAAGDVRRLLVSGIEHDSVRETAQALAEAAGIALETVSVTRDGVVDVADLETRLAAGGPALVAVMHANNETGVVQPTAEVARAVKAADGLLLVDAAQSFGKIEVDRFALWADYLAVSSHKLGGPPGVGALVLGRDAPLARRQHGGGQERGRRAGTENVAGIAGFAAAAEEACGGLPEFAELAGLRDELEARVAAARPDVRVWGGAAARLPNTSCLALPGCAGETQVMALDLAGVAVSAGAACSSGKVRASHVLAAMGASAEEAGSAIRVSLGWSTTRADVDRFVEAYCAAVARVMDRPRAAAGAA